MNIYQAKYQFLHRKYITPLKIFRKTLYLNQWFSCFKDYFSFPISQHNILIFWQPTPKLAETNAESVETETRVSNSLERFLFLLLLDVPPMTSRAGIISLPKCVGIYTKLKLVHGPLDVHHSCTSLLSFTFKNNFLNFVNSLEKNISWNVAETIAQWEISLINLEPEMYNTACDLEFKGDPNWGTITVHWIGACSAVALNRVEDHEWGKVIYPWRDYYGDRFSNITKWLSI